MHRQPNAILRVSFLGLSAAIHASALVVVVADGRGRAAPIEATQPIPVPAQVGETFEVPVDEEQVQAVESAQADPGEASATTVDVGELDPAPRPEPKAHRRPTAPHLPGDAPSAQAGPAPATFGAVGDRAAVEVATAFTRGFPQAASADPVWLSAPFGSAGTAEVTLVIDPSGTLIDSSQAGHPSPALAAGIRRTLALVRARTFVATGRQTRLRVSATVSPDQVHDGLHGDVFAIGGTFDHGQGGGFFALASGRRIDVKVVSIP